MKKAGEWGKLLGWDQGGLGVAAMVSRQVIERRAMVEDIILVLDTVEKDAILWAEVDELLEEQWAGRS